MLRRRLQQRRQEDVERAEADAEPVQRLAVGLLEMRDRAEHRLARKHAAGVGEHRGKRANAGRAGRDRSRPRRAVSSERRCRSICASSHRLEPGAQRGSGLRRQAVERARGAERRLEQRTAGREASEDVALPGDGEAAIVLGEQRKAARRALRPARRRGGRAPRRAGARRRRAAAACRQGARLGSTRKSKPARWPIGSGPTLTSPSAATVTGKRVGAARADVAHQHGGAAVDEALGQPLVKRVGQPRLDLAGALGPFGRLLQPVGAVRDIGPAANAGEAVGERLDVAAHIVEPRDFGGEPFVRHVPAFADVAEQAADHARSDASARPCGNRAGRTPPTAAAPATPVLAAIAGSSAISLRTARSIASGAGRSIGSSAFRSRLAISAPDVGEVELGIAPIDAVERAEAMLLDRVDLFVAESRRLPR